MGIKSGQSVSRLAIVLPLPDLSFYPRLFIPTPKVTIGASRGRCTKIKVECLLPFIFGHLPLKTAWWSSLITIDTRFSLKFGTDYLMNTLH